VVRLGLRGQILLALMLVTLVAITSVGAIAVWQTRAVLAADRMEKSAAAAESAARVLGLALDPQRPLGDPENLRRLGALDETLRTAAGADTLSLFAPDGQPIAGAARDDDPTALTAARAGAPAHARLLGGTLVAYAPLPGGAALRLSFPYDATLDALLARARRSVILLGAIDGLLLLVTAAWILRGVVVNPVRSLQHAAQRVADGDLSATAETRGPGELADLAIAFDRMTAALRAGRESLVRSQRLAGVGSLAAGVAHEIGNPLAAVRGYVEMLLSKGDKPLDPALEKDMLERVLAETLRIHRIVKELLVYSREPQGKEEAVPVDVRKVVDAAASLVRAQGRARDLAIEIDLPAGLPAVLGSEGPLVQVLLNLLLNATDAAKERIDVTAVARGERVILAVSDDGPGVPEAQRAQIFDPFFTTKDPGEGTGLGLSVSVSIVESLGGTLRLAESPHGARFEIDLPRAT
jgi:signal transduction histidine kinase